MFDIMVSVIVLTYNHEKYIKQAIDSILMQKVNFKYEILVGDDCSSDDTQNVLKEYQKSNPSLFRLFLRDSNIGATKNAYELLINARGKYLATCEGDDYWTDENKLQIQVDFLEKNKSFIGCCHDFVIVDDNGEPIPRKKLSWVRKKEIFTLDDYQGIYLPSQPSTFLRRNIFLDNKYDLSIVYKAHPMVGDRTMGMIYLSQGNFYFINSLMSCYRLVLNKKNITSIAYIENTNRVLDDYNYTISLDKYARDVLKKEGLFEKRKKDLFLSALFFAIFHPNNINRQLVKRIYIEGGKSLSYIFCLPFYLIKKVICKFI
jgi:glycosyltransferase involved in cell wall biosynthesis